MSNKKLLYRIIWEGRSRWQLPGALLGSFLGFFLLLLSIQVYQDIVVILGGSSDQEDQFVMINKKVNLFNTLGASAAFTEGEIAELNQQAFIESVGVFTPNQYRVSASSTLMGFYTELFFESVPTEYVDYEGEDFYWDEGDNELPIILSRDYLALYNFGFAPSQGLPQFTPSTIRKVSFDLTVKGNNLQKTFQGRIVGFSDRINSIIVPQNFMKYANTTFGGKAKPKPARLILGCKNAFDEKLETYLEEQNYELSSGRFIGGQLGKILWLLLGVIALIGFILLALSFLVVLLHFQLLLAQSATDIRQLLEQGFPLLEIRQVLHQRLLLMYGGILALVLLFLFLGRRFVLPLLAEQGFVLSGGLHWTVWLVAMVSGLGLFYLNYFNIKRRVEEMF